MIILSVDGGDSSLDGNGWTIFIFVATPITELKVSGCVCVRILFLTNLTFKVNYMCLVKSESSTEYTPAEVVDIVETVGASDEAVCNFLCDNKPIRASGDE